MQSLEKDILEFMVLTECSDQEKALHYLSMCENNIENAARLYVEVEVDHPISHSQQSVSSEPSQQLYEEKSEQLSQQDIKDVNTMIFNAKNPPPELIRQNSAPDMIAIEEDQKYQEKKKVNDDGILKNTLKFDQNALKCQEQNHGLDFQSYMQQQQIQTILNFQMGNFLDNIKKAHKAEKPLLVYLHKKESLLTFKKMICCKSLVQIINKSYQIVGFLENQYVYQQLPLQLKPQPPTFLMFQLDLTEEVVLMDNINLTSQTNFEELAEKFKQLNKQYMQENQIKNQVDRPKYLQNQNDNQTQEEYTENWQQDTQEWERQQLIQQQQDAYRIAEQQASEKQRKQQELIEKEQNKLLEQQYIIEERLFQKATILSSLPNEPEGEDGIKILFRFLHGTRTRRFNLNDKIQSLFDFALCQEDDCFNDPNSNIDLIQNFPRLKLQDKKDQTISDVFIDSNMVQLIVEECE